MSPGALSAVLAVVVAQAPALPQGWTTHTSPRGNYSAAFPNKPIEVARTVSRGDHSVALSIASYKKGSVVYSVATGELEDAPKDPSALLNAAVEVQLQTVKAATVEPTTIDIEGHPGRAFESTIPRSIITGGGIIKGRIYLIGDRLFEIVATQPATGANARPSEIDAFLASFKPTNIPAVRAPRERTTLAKADQDPKPDAPAPADTPSTTKPDTPAPADDPAPALDGWQIFRPQEGGIAVELPPGEPRRLEITQPTPVGNVTSRTYIFAHGKAIYQVVITDAINFNEVTTPAKAYLEGMRGGMLDVMGAKLVKETVIQIDGITGLETVATLPAKAGTPFPDGGNLRMRSVAHGDKVYQTVAVAPAGVDFGADGDAFVSSLRLDESGARPTAPRTPNPSINIPITKGEARVIDTPARDLPQGWTTYKHSDGSFTANFPRAPEERVQDVPLPDGRKIHMSLLGVQDPTEGLCLLAVQDMPTGTVNDNTVELSLDGAVQGLGRPTNATVKHIERITLDGLPGRDAQLEIPDTPRTPGGAFIFTRIIAKGDRLYLLSRIGKKDVVTLDSAMDFLDSFRLTPAQ